ncbi:hypothetical protein [Marinicella litoralis]|nr:hypothetical protein [Marinicella litoralis]
MEVFVAQSNWQHPSKLSHWLKHSLLPLLLILILLVLPNPWIKQTFNVFSSVLEIELKPKETEPMPQTVPVTESEPLPELETESQASKAKKAPLPQPNNQPKNNVTDQPPTNQPVKIQADTATKKKISSGDILLAAKNRTSVFISPEFQARSANQQNFQIPTVEIENWLADIPFLDESVDRPTIQMKFYAEGIEGSLEKFFDKITISKTFTTQYGTKIHCALIGVIAACGWK